MSARMVKTPKNTQKYTSIDKNRVFFAVKGLNETEILYYDGFYRNILAAMGIKKNESLNKKRFNWDSYKLNLWKKHYKQETRS